MVAFVEDKLANVDGAGGLQCYPVSQNVEEIMFKIEQNWESPHVQLVNKRAQIMKEYKLHTAIEFEHNRTICIPDPSRMPVE